MSTHTEWRADAACATAPDPDRFVGQRTASSQVQALAAQYCAACPVTRACLDYARATRSQGIWGGWLLPAPEYGRPVDLLR